MKFFSTLRTRFALLILLSTVPMILWFIYLASERRREDVSAMQQEALRLTRFAASNIERDLEAARVVLGSLSENGDVAELADPQRAQAVITELVSASKLFNNLAVVNPAGDVLVTARPVGEGVSVAHHTWFGTAMATKAFTVGGYRVGQLADEPSIFVGQPVLDTSGAVTSIVVGALDVTWVQKLVEDAHFPTGTAFHVVDRNGIIVVRYPEPEKYIGKQHNESRPDERGSGEKWGFERMEGVDGQERLYAFARVGGTEMVLRCGLTEKQAFAAANKALVRNLLSIAAFALLLVALSALGLNLLVMNQVKALIAATKQLATGDLSARSNVPYRAGELGVLAQSFDQMAESLEWRDAQLRESEAERGLSEAQFTNVVELAPEPIIQINEEGMICVFNRAAERLLGFQYREIFEESVSRFLPERDVERLLAICHAEDGAAANLELSVTAADGRSFTVPTSAAVSGSAENRNVTLILHPNQMAPASQI